MASSQSNLLDRIALVLRVILGLIFVYAAYTKLRDPWALFAMAIDSYGILPLRWVEFVAKTLPWFELILGLALILGAVRKVTTTVTALLLLVFFSLILRAHFKGQEINCGCFGPGEVISWKTMLRDGSMVAGAIFVTVMAFVRRNRPRATNV